MKDTPASREGERIMAFREIVDQDHAILLLREALRLGRISHAYLFVGPESVGKKAVAISFAQALNCLNADGFDACGSCPSCKKIAGGSHPDVRVTAPQGESLKIDQIRALRQEAMYPPFEGRWKVYILEDAEKMTAEAANSLLKVLEEPPERVVWILLATSTVSLLPTIVSRCQMVRFTLLPTALIKRALVERFNLPEAQARFLAALAAGRIGQAITWALTKEALAERETMLDFLSRVESMDALERLLAAEELGKQKEKLSDLLDIAYLWYRDLLVWSQARDEDLLFNLDKKETIAKIAPSFSPRELQRRIVLIEEAKEALRRNANPRLVLETLLLRMMSPEEAIRPG